MRDLSEKIKNYMKENSGFIQDFLANLIAIESTTYNEGPAVTWLKDKLIDFGYENVAIDPAGNCIGRVGTGNTVVLADAHIDTVSPGTAEEWGFNPLELKTEKGLLKGRGVVDDKGPLTALIFAGKAIHDLGLEDKVTYWLSASVAEEDVEGSCVKALMEKAPHIKPDAIIVAEPSGMKIIRGHKGRALIKIKVTGKAAHASAAHMGENALIKAIPIIQGIDNFHDFKADPFLGKGSIEVTKVICENKSLNTIPGNVTIIADRRISRGETKEELLKELEPLLTPVKASASIDIEYVVTHTGYEIEQEDYFPSWVLEEDHPLIASAKNAYLLTCGTDPIVTKWDFCTNATYLCGITGIPSVGFGPGDSSLCHSSEEALSLEELTAAASVYAMIALNFAENHSK